MTASTTETVTKKQSSVFKAKEREELFKVNKVPGPGTYEEKAPESPSTQECIFKSTVDRLKSLKVSAKTPGSGAYEIKNTIENKVSRT